jgi:hypothetical protein
MGYGGAVSRIRNCTTGWGWLVTHGGFKNRNALHMRLVDPLGQSSYFGQESISVYPSQSLPRIPTALSHLVDASFATDLRQEHSDHEHFQRCKTHAHSIYPWWTEFLYLVTVRHRQGVCFEVPLTLSARSSPNIYLLSISYYNTAEYLKLWPKHNTEITKQQFIFTL